MTTPASTHLFIAGGTFDTSGGRASGYIRKLAEALASLLPHTALTVVNGGAYDELAAHAQAIPALTALLWFADVPNDLPKLLPSLKERFPGLTLVQSKNNRRGVYSRAQLAQRMAASGAAFLLEFADGPDGQLLGSLLRRDGEVLLEGSPHINDVAVALAAAVSGTDRWAKSKKRVCVVGARGTVSRDLQAGLARMSMYASVTTLATDEARASLADGVPDVILDADLVVLATDGFASPEIVARLPATTRVLDISPSFRVDDAWVYGLPELPGSAQRIADAHRVANPGCFATSAILLLAPLVREGVLATEQPLYLDGVGGYMTGGAKLIEQSRAGELSAEAAFSLTREHRHVAEIRTYAGVPAPTPVWFTPKIADFPQGIRMQVPLFGCTNEEVLRSWRTVYAGTDIEVADETPSRLPADAWAHRAGARLYAQSMPGGVLAICVMDNLRKGAVDSALRNIQLMLGLERA